jgi:hypothetical protein
MRRRDVLGFPAAAGVRVEVGAAKGQVGPLTLPGGRADRNRRSGQQYLFQSAAQSLVPTRVAGGEDLRHDVYGPTAEYVDRFCAWPWSRTGGDWLDRRGERHGPVPWFSLSLGKAPQVGTQVHPIDVTATLQWVQQRDRWCALLLRATGRFLRIAGIQNPIVGGPTIRVVYEDGRIDRLRCRVAAQVTSNSSSTMAPTALLPAFLEFDRPNAPLRDATLFVAVVDSPGAAQLDGFVLDPPADSPVREPGLADALAPLDADLQRHPAVIGVHRYLDGSRLEDFVVADRLNVWDERAFDPSLWGEGPAQHDKLPHRGVGRWVNVSTPPHQLSMVDSRYRGDSFAPLAPGVGAMRLHMPVPPSLGDGAIVGYGGTTGANAMIFMPEPLLGRLDRIFVRYYLRIGETQPPGGMSDVRRRYQVYPDESRRLPRWTDRAGKFGITPEHTTNYGGVSGSSGMGYGWQMRLSWAECDAGTGGPDENGWSPGFHLHDFNQRQPSGHNYALGPRHMAAWGQRNGWGGMLYLNRWYCLETELKLNTVHAGAPGYRPDGALRSWVDGRLCFEREGMVFRALPLFDPGKQAGRYRACRELGVRALWMNWFHGGMTPNSVERTLFVTGLAWGHERIGPMRLGAAEGRS